MIANNVADLVQSVRDGEIGIIDQVLIGDLIVSALYGLDTPKTISLTRRRIQSGADMSTMAVDSDDSISMDCCFANPELSLDGALTAALTGNASVLTQTWRDKRDNLYQKMNDRELLEITTQDDVFQSMMITGIYPIFDSDENWDAFVCTVILERANVYGDEENSDSAFHAKMQNVSGL
jgi:hypothetical protein